MLLLLVQQLTAPSLSRLAAGSKKVTFQHVSINILVSVNILININVLNPAFGYDTLAISLNYWSAVCDHFVFFKNYFFNYRPCYVSMLFVCKM